MGTLKKIILDKNALRLNNQNMGENGLLFKLKIGSEKERAGEAERESAPLESTFGVRDDGDSVVFAPVEELNINGFSRCWTKCQST